MLGSTLLCNTSSQLRLEVRVPASFSWRDLAFLFGTSIAPLLSYYHSPYLSILSSPLDWGYFKARFCVSYDKLGLVAVTNDPQVSVASTWKGLFLPHTMYVHCGLAVALLYVIFTLGPGRWKNCVWNIASLMAEGKKKKTVKNVLAIKSSGKWHMSVPSAYG